MFRVGTTLRKLPLDDRYRTSVAYAFRMRRAAPEDRDSVIVLVPVGHISAALPKSSDWDKVVEETRVKVITEIERRLDLTGFRDLIEHETVNTPITWGEKFNLHRGSILGLSHSFL